jgi:modification methylase
MGSGTTAVVAKKLGRNYLGIELNQEYIEIAEKRIETVLSQTKLCLLTWMESSNIFIEQ